MFKRLMHAGRSRALVAVAVVALLGTSATIAAAQPGPGRGRGGHGDGVGGPGGGFGGPFATGVEALRGLDLTEAQREQVRTIVQSHREESQALQQRHHAATRALEEATRGTDEAAIRQQGEAVGTAIADAAVLKSRVRAEVWTVLTPEQHTKAEQLRVEHETRMKERQTRMQQRPQERQKQRGAAQPKA